MFTDYFITVRIQSANNDSRIVLLGGNLHEVRAEQLNRAHKEVYKTEEGIVKIFGKEHPKADVFNEALNTARVEATGLDIPKVKQVTQIDGRWSLVIECKEGKTLEEMMNVDPAILRNIWKTL